MADRARLDAVFFALSDATRRAMLARLARGPASVTELARPFEMSLPAVSKHLKVLERAGLVERQIDGRVHKCHLEPKPMSEAAEWIERHRAFWKQQFAALDRYLQRRPGSRPGRNQIKKRKERS